MSYYIYIVRCCDGSLYTGSTPNVKKRVALHNAKKGAKYTRSRVPVELVYAKKCTSKKIALRLERKIKSLSRREKISLVKRGIL